MRRAMILGLMLALTACATGGGARPGDPATIALPGLRYQILHSGPASGARPTRADQVEVRYVGRLADGAIFSTSADDGAGVSTFPVRVVIPGFAALVRLMHPGDRWRMIIPAYLAYGAEGKAYSPPEANLKRAIPPDSPLTFDVELVSITPGEPQSEPPMPSPTVPTAARLQGLTAADARALIQNLQNLQSKLRRDEPAFFELLSGAPAFYPMAMVPPRTAFLDMHFDQALSIERVATTNSLWRPHKLVLSPDGPGQSLWYVEVVLGFNDKVERVQMVYKQPPPF